MRSWRDIAANYQQGPGMVRTLRTVYQDPRDIDLYLGALLEKLPGVRRRATVAGRQVNLDRNMQVVGATHAYIIANTFAKFRRGDRFFYENGSEKHRMTRFTPPELREIRKYTMKHLLCYNMDDKNQDLGKSF